MIGGGRRVNSRGSPADFGLVGLVIGGAATLLLGIVTIGVGALLGRIPLVLGVLLSLAALVTVVGLLVTVATARSRRPPRPMEPGRDGDH